MENFTISSTNPNQETGGGGCLCYPTGSRDCKPPFVVFHGDELLDPLSPHAVCCKGCLGRAVERMETEEAIPVGDIPTVEEVPDEDVTEAPVDPATVDVEARLRDDPDYIPAI